MAVQKRKRSLEDVSDLDDFSDADSGDDVDISAALVGKKSKKPTPAAGSKQSFGEDDDGDEALEDIIQESITKRNVKSGTELLKKTKGKAKMAKGEVGGGSFQSMGTHRAVFMACSQCI